MSRSERSARSEKVPFRNTGGDRPRHQEGYRDRPYREREESRSHASNGRQPSYGQGRNNQHSRPPSSHSDHQSRMPKSPQHQSPPSHRTYTDKESFSDKCSRICSRRGILQFVEITAGLLVLICVVASYAVLMGYTSAAGFSTFSIDSAYSPFEGTELQQVREADMKYTQLRAPGVYGGVGFSLLLCALTVVFLMLGSKPLHSVSIKILFAEFIFDCLAFAGYIIAVGLYLYFIKHVNSTDICKTRERLYAGRGYTWMNCEVQGGDAAVALFGLIAGCLYLPSAIFCWLHIRKAREFKKNHQHCRYTPQPRSQNEYKTSRNDMPMTQMHPSTLV
uniref:MARVEL domain-containing protein n=1 Tax=Leptobrachium leishanense TaxID=445787 RepID=A0A8C5MTU8_9ANUR